MKPMYAIIYFIVLSLVVNAAYSYIDSSVTYRVEDESIESIHEIYSNEDLVEVFVPLDAYDFLIYIKDLPANFTLDRLGGYKLVNISNIFDSSKIIMQYKTNMLLEEGRSNYFNYNYKMDSNISNFTLILPEGAILTNPIDSANPSVNPLPETVSTDGRALKLKWSFKDIESVQLFVSYEEDAFEFSYLIILGGLLIMVIIIGVLLVYYNGSNKEEQLKHLLEPEKVVISNLKKKKDNIMWQKELQIATGFTKSKLSRTVRNLEERNIVRKIPYGASNKIKLEK